MWTQVYAPIAGSLGLSALVAAIPVFALLLALGVFRMPAWKASLLGLVSAMLVALFVYGMPAGLMFSSVFYGAAFGLFPIGWIVYAAIVLYRVTVETGKFEIIKNSVGSLTNDRRLQALLIAFAFGAFIEGASGFGTPVAVAAAMLAGLGFPPFYAAAICLLANTAPVAFGAIGIPVITLAGITGLPLRDLSANVGRICAPVSLFIPSYLIAVMGGLRALRAVLPGALVCGVAFAGTQFLVSNYVGPYLTDILGSIAAIVCLVVLLRFWRPAVADVGDVAAAIPPRHTAGEIIWAWSPYFLLVVFVCLWGEPHVKRILDTVTRAVPWPGLHNQILRVAPAVGKPSPYGANFNLNLLSAAGTSCMLAAICSALLLRVSVGRFFGILVATLRQLMFSLITIATVLAIAYLMNYSGATATLGLAFAATGAMFPFFSALLGWMGVFLTGSDTSANALFGNLQVVTAHKLNLNASLMAASNSSGGVMGKMISLQSIAVAAAATGMPAHEEAKLFRFTLKHSIFLACVIGLVVTFYAYVMPGWVK
jgi:L-lactate transport